MSLRNSGPASVPVCAENIWKCQPFSSACPAGRGTASGYSAWFQGLGRGLPQDPPISEPLLERTHLSFLLEVFPLLSVVFLLSLPLPSEADRKQNAWLAI